MNRSKQKGTHFETAVVNFMREHGYPHVERRALNGSTDKGDIAGLPGVVIEVKNCAKIELAKWLRETDAEIANAGAETGAVWIKQRGKASAGDGFIIQRPALWLPLATGQEFS